MSSFFSEKTQRLKEAKDEAEREIAEFKAKKEEEFKAYNDQVTDSFPFFPILFFFFFLFFLLFFFLRSTPCRPPWLECLHEGVCPPLCLLLALIWGGIAGLWNISSIFFLAFFHRQFGSSTDEATKKLQFETEQKLREVQQAYLTNKDAVIKKVRTAMISFLSPVSTDP